VKPVYQDNGHKNVVITGCSSGIGQCAMVSLHQRGYRVIATARNQSDVDRLNSWGYQAVRLDLADSASIDQAVDEIKQLTEHRIYALFNNAAYGQPGAVEDITTPVLREQFEANFFGWHQLTCALIPLFREQGFGRIIQNSSLLGYVAMRNRGAYNASKFALEGLSDTLRLELAGTGIHVILIEPGPITSNFRQNALEKFLDNVDRQNSVHHDRYSNALSRLKSERKDGPFTLPPEAVVKALIHCLESPKPKKRYRITFPAQALWYLRRFVPTTVLDKILMMGAE